MILLGTYRVLSGLCRGSSRIVCVRMFLHIYINKHTYLALCAFAHVSASGAIEASTGRTQLLAFLQANFSKAD